MEATTRQVGNSLEGTAFICPESGTGNSISLFLRSRNGGNTFSCALYKWNATDTEWQLDAYTEQRTLDDDPNNDFNWFDFNFVSPPLLENGASYLLVVWGDTGDCLVKRGSIPGGMMHSLIYAWPNFPSVHDGIQMNAGPYSIYCTYTAIPSCADPYGIEGDVVCGDGGINQPETTHLYRCDCVGGVCSWTDLGYDPTCDVPHCINPSGNEGDIICGNLAYGQDPTHLYRCDCVGGVCSWTDLGYDPSCDLPDCTNPNGNEGDIICGNLAYGQDPTHLYRCDCVGDVCSWTDLGYDPSCDVAYTTYYVANAGNDSNLGTSPGEAWQTINKVTQEIRSTGVIQNGDHVLFNGGDIFDDDSLIVRLGGISESQRMVIGAYGSGKPLFSHSTGVHIEIYTANSHIVIENLMFSGSDGVSLKANGTGTDFYVNNCEFYDKVPGNNHCIRFGHSVSDYLIENCYLEPNNPGGHGVLSQGSNGTVRNCTIIGPVKDGISLHENSAPVGNNHLLENIYIEGTYESGIDLNTGACQNVTIRNVEMTDCSLHGLSISNNAYNVLIEDCYVHDLYSIISGNLTGVGLIINGSQGVHVRNSVFKNCRDLVQIYGVNSSELCGDILIENSLFMETTADGVYIVRIGTPSGGPWFTGDPIEFINNVLICNDTNHILAFRGNSHATDSFFNFAGNIWWRTNQNPEPFGLDATQGDFDWDYWKSLFPTDTFQEPPVCRNPIGWESDIICGDPAYGQEPTHLYRCDCVAGVCSWTDLGYDPTCDVPHCNFPFGNEGDQMCGNPAYGQDPTHLYRCDCVGGICSWTDLGYFASCDLQEPCANPVGSHGDIICGDPAYGQDPTHQYECIDGVWTDLGYNSTCDLQEPCANPAGIHGDIICGDASYGQNPTHQYECIDGVWTDLGYSPGCDIQQPCTDPAGIHGQIDDCGAGIGGQPETTHSYQCNDGTWNDIGENCPTCPDCAEEEIPWLYIGAAGAVAVSAIAIGIALSKKR